MKELVLLASILSVIQAHDHFQHFFGKYAAAKLLSSCFGTSYMEEWVQNLTQACTICNQQRPDEFLSQLPINDFVINNFSPFSLYSTENQVAQDEFEDEDLFNFMSIADDLQNPMDNFALQSILRQSIQNNLRQPVLLMPLLHPLLRGFHQFPAGYGNPQLAPPKFNFDTYGIHPFGNEEYDFSDFADYDDEIYRRKKREVRKPFYNAEKINQIYRAIRQKAGNFTCIGRELDIFNKNMAVNVGWLVNQIKESNVDPELESDLFEAITDCVRLSSCQPLNKKNLMPPAVQRAITYMKCENKQRLAACVKFDLLKQQEKFDTAALSEVPAGSDVDLGDKMLAIVWGKHDHHRH